jgi:hypothetical protein
MNLPLSNPRGEKKPSITQKHLFFSQRNPINIHKWESPRLDHNIVEDLKTLKANMSVMDMCRIHQQNDFLLPSLKSIESPITSIELGEVPTPTDPKNKPNVNTCFIGKKGKPFVPPFLLTFEVFNINLHNCLVDSGASSNVMPLSICKKLNVVPLKSYKHVIKLDKTQVNVIRELKYVMITMATHPKSVQVINIIVVDIP